MMKNKKGFTLVELVLVVIILGVILAFALPNITSTLEKNKKDQMIIDAKDMVEKAKNYALKTNDYPTTEDCKSFSLTKIDSREEIKESPFGKIYLRGEDKSYVKICLNNGSYIYYVQLTDGLNKIDKVDYMKLDKSGKYSLVKIG